MVAQRPIGSDEVRWGPMRSDEVIRMVTGHFGPVIMGPKCPDTSDPGPGHFGPGSEVTGHFGPKSVVLSSMSLIVNG